MFRGLPYSLIVHLLVLAGVVLFGAHVPAPNLKPQRVISVRMVHPEKPKPQQAEPEQQVKAPEPKPPEPKPVPQKQPDQKSVKPEPEEPEQKEEPEPEPEQKPAEALDEAALSSGEPTISGTDEPFPFAWYLDIVKGRITRNWNPTQLGIREGSERTCAVHFVIERSGAVTRATLVQSSGIALLDREGLRAVQAAHPLPPLPNAFASRSLGVTFVFHLRSGL
jgi:TonB family protein